MISSAHICYDTRQVRVTLSSLAEIIAQSTDWQTSYTKWEGCGIVIPQLLVHTPIPFLFQIEDDPEWVPAENMEFGKSPHVLTEESDLFKHLSRCDARLAIQPNNGGTVIADGRSITVSALGGAVDPQAPEVSEVLRLVASKIDGLIHDCVHGGLHRVASFGNAPEV